MLGSRAGFVLPRSSLIVCAAGAAHDDIGILVQSRVRTTPRGSNGRAMRAPRSLLRVLCVSAVKGPKAGA
jgi:hypothetical protein